MDGAKSDFLTAPPEALVYFGIDEQAAVLMSIGERIARLETVVLAKELSNEARGRFLEDLAYYRYVQSEYHRLNRVEKKAKEHIWLSIWVSLSDHLASASGGLHETLDFARFQTGGSAGA